MLGTSVENLRRAINTYANDVGPGQYNRVDSVGKLQPNSRNRNMPSVTMGVPRVKAVLNPETRGMIPSNLKTPSPDHYTINTDNRNFNRNGMSISTKEERFFNIRNMSQI